jgi:hypothetical protein
VTPDLSSRLDVSLTVDGDNVRFEDGPPSYGNGVYRIGDASILVLNHLWPRSQIALISAARPASIAGVVAMAVLPSSDSLARIIVDVVEPASLASSTVALAAVHAAYDEELEPEAAVQCVVRVLDRDLRARVAYDSARHEWSSQLSTGGEPERRALEGCAFYRSIQIRDGFGAWSPHGFRIEGDPRAADNAIGFSVFAIGGREIAVITEPLTPAQLDELVATPRPSSIDAVVALTHQPMSSDVAVSAIEPTELDGSLVATAAACAAASSGFGSVSPEYRVRLRDGHSAHVVLDFHDEDWTRSARVNPELGPPEGH